MLLMYSPKKAMLAELKIGGSVLVSGFFFRIQFAWLLLIFFSLATILYTGLIWSLCVWVCVVCTIVIIIFNSIEIMVPFSGNLSTCFFHVMLFFVVPYSAVRRCSAYICTILYSVWKKCELPTAVTYHKTRSHHKTHLVAFTPQRQSDMASSGIFSEVSIIIQTM